MGLLNVVISAAGKFLDVVGLLLDLNFLIVHTVVRTFLAVVAFIADLPSLTLNLLLQVGNLLLSSAVYLAQGTLSLLGGTALALEGLLESLKMVGYLSMHVLLRGKEHLCRGLVSVVEACGIAVSLVVYFANTVVNFALIATQNVYLAAVGAWQTVSSPLQEVLELALTSFTFLHSSLAGTSAVLWSPCKLLLDFVASLLQMFVSVFILNVYGLLLTVTIALTTTAYLNPRLSRQVAVHVLVYVNSFPALRRTCRTLWLLVSTLGSTPRSLRRHIQHLQRRLRHLHLLERRFWQQVSHLSSLLGLVLRTMLQRDNVNRARGDGDAGDDRRDPPDGRAGDGAQQEPSSSDRSLKTSLSLGKDRKLLPAESLLTLLKEQEERKKCVICQDCTKTVVLLPCRHLCLCRDCTNILLRQPLYQQNCPLCRHMILNTMDVYL